MNKPIKLCEELLSQTKAGAYYFDMIFRKACLFERPLYPRFT